MAWGWTIYDQLIFHLPTFQCLAFMFPQKKPIKCSAPNLRFTTQAKKLRSILQKLLTQHLIYFFSPSHQENNSTQTFPHLLFHHHTCFVLLFLDDLRGQFQTHLISRVWCAVCEHLEGRIYPPQESWDLKTGGLEIPAIESQTLPSWRVQSLILRAHKIHRVYTPHPPTGKPFLDVPLEVWIKG